MRYGVLEQLKQRRKLHADRVRNAQVRNEACSHSE